MEMYSDHGWIYLSDCNKKKTIYFGKHWEKYCTSQVSSMQSKIPHKILIVAEFPDNEKLNSGGVEMVFQNCQFPIISIIYFMKYFIIIPKFSTVSHILARFFFHTPNIIKRKDLFFVYIE